jgi:serine/threonine protein kinase
VPQGHYEILRPIGAGGMAELYLARTRGNDGSVHLVVLKRILPHLARDTAFIEMFLNEARIAATLQHPNVVSVTDFGQRDGDYFIAMEYVHGADLGALLDVLGSTDGRLPLDVALTILQHACAGMHHAHEQRGPDGSLLEVVHRDVSPSNVMIGYDGAIKVTDFGIATAAALTRTTRAGTVKGKVSYMSPEQCKGGRIDRRADVFALGILLYETTLMSRLFVGDNDYALMTQVIEGRITAPRDVEPSYPPALEEIVMRALAVDPDDRFASAEELQHAIEDFAVTHGLSLSPLSVSGLITQLLGPRPHPAIELAAQSTADGTRVVAAPRPQRSRTAWMAAAGAVFVIAAALGGVSLAQPEPPPMQETAPAPAPEFVLLPTPVPVPGESELVIEMADDEPIAPPMEEELIVIEDEGGATTQGRSSKRRRANVKSSRTYSLDEAAPPR